MTDTGQIRAGLLKLAAWRQAASASAFGPDQCIAGVDILNEIAESIIDHLQVDRDTGAADRELLLAVDLILYLEDGLIRPSTLLWIAAELQFAFNLWEQA